MPCKYMLYQKELYIVPENLTKNRTCQSWRGRQLAMSDDYDALKEYAEELAKKAPRFEWYIEERP